MEIEITNTGVEALRGLKGSSEGMTENKGNSGEYRNDDRSNGDDQHLII